VAHTVVLPRLGNTVESCILNSWLVQVGDDVTATTELCEVETDKSTVQVPAGFDGVLLAVLAGEGDEVPVLAPIAVIGSRGEPIGPPTAVDAASPVHESTSDSSGSDVDSGASVASVATPAASSAGRPATSPRARASAIEHQLPLSTVPEGSGPHGRILAQDVQAVLDGSPQLTRSAADRVALDDRLPTAPGTGIGGRVREADLQRDGAAALASSPSAERAEAGDDVTTTTLRGIRKLIATRMTESLATTAQVSYDITAPADALLELRRRLKASDPALGLAGVTIGDLVAFAAVRVATRFPAINAHLVGDELRSFSQVNVGLAVDTPRGLLVPTVLDASARTLRDFSATTKALVADCQAGTIAPDLLTGATFTVTNLGSFGIEGFTPILNAPQTAILGVSAIVPRPTIDADGHVTGAERRLGLSLTADHRVVDGADAARFLSQLVSAIEHIDLTVMS
jgi:pyruvate dehydrogenase E2 component (dihydrolipoamide acetyltransferase)